MLVREVMSTPVITVGKDATVKEAIELLERHDIAAMPVLDAAGRLVGVVSEADVIREMVVPDPRAHEVPVRLTRALFFTRVSDVMSTRPLTVTSDTELAKAADLMTSTVLKSLPVVDYGRIVASLARQDARIEAEADELFRQAEYDWLVEVNDGIATVDGPVSDAEQRLAETLVCTVPGVVGVHFRNPAEA